ncbi:glycosyltransferase family 4 protein [Thalassobacillus devorans]|uniref:glycosyltransferase family 4 protein n=1 Tax=Thalassobacillus devorans TaxID=279813 RepID=UPI000A1CB566|nr:glycosyltransferase family 4 protein [Thalassobacillus devorans]
MTIALITPGYPSNDNKYNLGFVHTRVKKYISLGMKIDVFVIVEDKSLEYIDYYEGVNVNYCTIDSVFNKIEGYEGIFIHFISHKLAKKLFALNYNKPILIWVHGTEVISGFRRLFNFKSEGFLAYSKYFLWSIKQRNLLNRYIKNSNVEKVGFIFPSSWMKSVTERDLKLKLNNSRLIPNPIDKELFYNEGKSTELRFRIISIKSFRSYKYGTDILQEIIAKVNRDVRFKKYQDKLVFEVYGDGKLFDKHTNKLKKFKNVNLYKKFLNHKEMSDVFDSSGIYINTTRQDAQGVTMCEAMMNGLVTVNSYNTAIPEFVMSGYNGELCNSVNDFVDSIYKILESPSLFQKLSANAGKFMLDRCNIDHIVREELDFYNDL